MRVWRFRICTLLIALSSVSCAHSPTLTAERLAVPMREVRFEEIPFDDVLLQLSAAISVPIRVDWGSLEKAGIQRTALVSLHLENITVLQVLKILFSTNLALQDFDIYPHEGELWIRRRTADTGAGLIWAEKRGRSGTPSA